MSETAECTCNCDNGYPCDVHDQDTNEPGQRCDSCGKLSAVLTSGSVDKRYRCPECVTSERRPDCTCSQPDYQDEFCPQHGRDATETPKPCICEHLAYYHTEMTRTGRLVEIPCTADGCRCPDYMPNYLTRGPL